MNVDPKKLKYLLAIKRDSKLIVNEKLLDRYRGKPKQIRKPSDITSKTTSEDFSNKYRSRGHRIGLNIDPFKMAFFLPKIPTSKIFLKHQKQRRKSHGST